MGLFRNIRRFFDENSPEGNIIIIICFFGLLRSVLALISDWHTWSTDSTLQFRNLIFGLVFGSVIILEVEGWAKEWLRVIFGLIFCTVMSLHYLITGALEDFASFTALGSLTMLILVYRGVWMFIVPSIYLLLILSVMFYPEMYTFLGAGSENVSSPFRWDINFWIASSAVSILLYYLKNTYNKRALEISVLNEKLKASNEELSKQNQFLETTRAKLDNANHILNQRVEERTRELFKKNAAISDYMELNSREVKSPLYQTSREVKKWHPSYELSQESIDLKKLLRESADELEDIYVDINNQLNANDEVPTEYSGN